ncbi:MAG: hypothetical protein EZS28_008199 [Streblomastix strix]|uniref:Uncharacterized protein n=1 Tax=Streblomastix strix TaxID=222440 RepID=A0A5J4WN97_9EUKA|nr:MAG: hypothetical protein EZS28_008199 [Streblomastix strix]
MARKKQQARPALKNKPKTKDSSKIVDNISHKLIKNDSKIKNNLLFNLNLDLDEALYPGRTRYEPQKPTALSKYKTPTDIEQDSVSSKQMQERTEMIDTKELMVVIYSMEVISYRIPFLGENMEDLIKIHKNKKNIIKYIHSDDDYNIYYWYNLTCITIPDSKGIEIDRHSRIVEGKRLLFEFYNVKKENQREFLKNYPGFNWDDSLKLPIIIFFFLTVMTEANISCILLMLRSYQDPNNNSKRKMDTHIKECQKNNDQIKKFITLEKFPKPFVLHITSNKTYRYLLAHNRESEYKATQYYITFMFQTELQKIRGYQYPILVPTAIASTTKVKNYIKTISYDNIQDNIVEKWLDQVFSKALQIRDDNKFADDVPQQYEEYVIEFDFLKSATTLIFKNIKSMKYEIIDRPGLRSYPIHIIVKSTDNSINIKFIDAKNYVSANMELDDFLRDIEQYPLIPYTNHNMDYIHAIYGNTDRLCLAIANESWPIKDKKLWD